MERNGSNDLSLKENVRKSLEISTTAKGGNYVYIVQLQSTVFIISYVSFVVYA